MRGTSNLILIVVLKKFNLKDLNVVNKLLNIAIYIRDNNEILKIKNNTIGTLFFKLFSESFLLISAAKWIII